MKNYTSLLESYVKHCREILADRLAGVYLHGSAAMGGFNAAVSDLDLLIVTEGAISDEAKVQLMEMTVAHNEKAPAKGIEMSVVRRDVCNPFVYPTPFELHFSCGTLGWYRSDPQGYIEKMNGTDRDLAAHFVITRSRGMTLWGESADSVFGAVSPQQYFDSICADIENAESEITGNLMYYTLNLCRVLAFRREALILSKQEGGEWGKLSLPRQFRHLAAAALQAYSTGRPMKIRPDTAQSFARYMVGEIMK